MTPGDDLGTDRALIKALLSQPFWRYIATQAAICMLLQVWPHCRDVVPHSSACRIITHTHTLGQGSSGSVVEPLLPYRGQRLICECSERGHD